MTKQLKFKLDIQKFAQVTMTKQELEAKEKELADREKLLTDKENKLTERENGLNEREEKLNERKEDTAEVVKDIKAQYEEKLLKQHDKYEEKVKSRDEVIKQLLADGGNANEPQGNPIVDKINAHRTAQNKKW